VRVGQAQVSARMDGVDVVVAGLRAAPLANPTKPLTRGEALQQQQQQQQQPQQLVTWLAPLPEDLRPFAVALLAEPGPLSGTTTGALSDRQKKALSKVNVLTGKVTGQSVPGRAAAVDAMVLLLLEAVALDSLDDPVEFIRSVAKSLQPIYPCDYPDWFKTNHPRADAADALPPDAAVSARSSTP